MPRNMSPDRTWMSMKMLTSSLVVVREMMKRPKQPNLSFFAFTATAKFRSLLLVWRHSKRHKSAP